MLGDEREGSAGVARHAGLGHADDELDVRRRRPDRARVGLLRQDRRAAPAGRGPSDLREPPRASWRCSSVISVGNDLASYYPQSGKIHESP